MHKSTEHFLYLRILAGHLESVFEFLKSKTVMMT